MKRKTLFGVLCCFTLLWTGVFFMGCSNDTEEDNSAVLTAMRGLSFTLVSDNKLGSFSISSVAYGGGKFVAVGGETTITSIAGSSAIRYSGKIVYSNQQE